MWPRLTAPFLAIALAQLLVLHALAHVGPSAFDGYVVVIALVGWSRVTARLRVIGIGVWIAVFAHLGQLVSNSMAEVVGCFWVFSPVAFEGVVRAARIPPRARPRSVAAHVEVLRSWKRAAGGVGLALFVAVAFGSRRVGVAEPGLLAVWFGGLVILTSARLAGRGARRQMGVVLADTELEVLQAPPPIEPGGLHVDLGVGPGYSVRWSAEASPYRSSRLASAVFDGNAIASASAIGEASALEDLVLTLILAALVVAPATALLPPLS